MNRLIHGDCLEVMRGLPADSFDMVFADPPDNIGLGYNEYEDRLPESEYFQLLADIIRQALRVAPIAWVSFNSRHTIRIAVEAHHMEAIVKPCVQTFTFGTQQKSDLKNCHRPLWRFMRPGARLYPEQCLEPTWRLQNGDPRANPAGAVPSDVFDFPRVTGNSREKRKWHKTQLHQGLVERCVKLCTPPGGSILDPFGGTGTTYRAAKSLGRFCTLIEIDGTYCQEISRETGLEIMSFATNSGSGTYSPSMTDPHNSNSPT